MSKNLTPVLANVAKNLMNTIQMGVSYKGWSDEFSYSEVKDDYHNIKEQLKAIVGNVTALTVEELRELGFMLWDDETEEKLFLVPLWAFDLIADGTELISISGDKVVKGSDEIDLDVRFGCIAYGIVKEDK